MPELRQEAGSCLDPMVEVVVEEARGPMEWAPVSMVVPTAGRICGEIEERAQATRPGDAVRDGIVQLDEQPISR